MTIAPGLAKTTVVIGAIAVSMILLGRYVLFTGMAPAPLIQVAQVGTPVAEAFAGLDRNRHVNPGEELLAPS